MKASAWGRAVAVLTAATTGHEQASAWGRAVTTLAVPAGSIPSMWGRAATSIAPPHLPIGVWDGTTIQWVPINT